MDFLLKWNVFHAGEGILKLLRVDKKGRGLMIDPNVKQDLREISKKLTNLRGLFDLGLKQEMIENFEEKMAYPDFWDDNEKAQALIAEMNAVKSSVDQYLKSQADYDDAVVMIELADEEGDDSLAGEIGETIKDLVGRVEEFELQLLLNQPYDKMNAILESHPGAGDRVAGLGPNVASYVHALGGETRL